MPRWLGKDRVEKAIDELFDLCMMGLSFDQAMEVLKREQKEWEDESTKGQANLAGTTE